MIDGLDPDWLVYFIHLFFFTDQYFFKIPKYILNMPCVCEIYVRRHFTTLTSTDLTFNHNVSCMAVSGINDTCLVKYNLDGLFVKLFQASLI